MANRQTEFKETQIVKIDSKHAFVQMHIHTLIVSQHIELQNIFVGS